MKNIIIVICLLLTISIFSQSNTVVKIIGDDEFTFIIPEDYDTLVKFYKKLIDVYVESELSTKQTIANLESYQKDLDIIKQNAERTNEELKLSKEKLLEYMRAKRWISIYLGLGGGYTREVNFHYNYTVTDEIWVRPMGIITIKDWVGIGLSGDLGFGTKNGLSDISGGFSLFVFGKLY